MAENEEMNKCERAVAVFDVCETLYYSNTTHDFIKFVAQRRFSARRKFIYFVVNNRKSPLRYSLIALSLLSRFDFHKRINVFLLRGQTAADLKKLADEFVEKYLCKRQIHSTHRLLEDLKNEGMHIVLCSSSIEPVIEAIAAKLKVEDFIATRLKFAGESFGGEILEDVTDNKDQVLQRRNFGEHLEYAVSDNRGDAVLLQAARKRIAVVHSQKNYDFWKRHSVEILDLRS